MSLANFTFLDIDQVFASCRHFYRLSLSFPASKYSFRAVKWIQVSSYQQWKMQCSVNLWRRSIRCHVKFVGMSETWQAKHRSFTFLPNRVLSTQDITNRPFFMTSIGQYLSRKPPHHPRWHDGDAGRRYRVYSARGRVTDFRSPKLEMTSNVWFLPFSHDKYWEVIIRRELTVQYLSFKLLLSSAFYLLAVKISPEIFTLDRFFYFQAGMLFSALEPVAASPN